MWNKDSYLIKYVEIMGHKADIEKTDHILMLAYLYDTPKNEVKRQKRVINIKKIKNPRNKKLLH